MALLNKTEPQRGLNRSLILFSYVRWQVGEIRVDVNSFTSLILVRTMNIFDILDFRRHSKPPVK